MRGIKETSMDNPFRTRFHCDVTCRAFTDKYNQAIGPYYSRAFKRQMQILARNARRLGVANLYD